MFAKIEVRSGGVFIRDPNEKTSYGNYDLFAVEMPDGKRERMFRIIRNSSLSGMISYLLGEKRPIKNLQDPDREQIVAKQMSINVLGKTTTVKDNIISCGTVHLLTARRDTVYNEKSLIKAPNVNLSQFSWEQSSEVIQFFKNELTAITGCQKLSEIYDLFLSEYKDYKKSFNKSKKEENFFLLEELDLSEKDFIEPPINSSKASITLITKMNSKIEAFVEAKKSREFPKSPNDFPFFPLYISLIKEIKKSLLAEKLDFSNLTSSKWSCFDSSLEQPRHWLNDEHVPYVRSAPAYVLSLDFDIYIKNLSSSQINRFLNGPRMAYWGEGGVAKLSLIDDSPPAEAAYKDQIIACKCYFVDRVTNYRFKV